MPQKTARTWCFVILFLAFVLSSHAQPPATSIGLVTTFDYPREGATNTFGNGIADTGIIVGTFRLPSNELLSYERTPGGRFHRISFPGSDFTSAGGINVSGVVCGWMGQASAVSGFFYDGQTYTQYDVPGSTDTFIEAENDNGDFVGIVDISNTDIAFANIGGVVTTFAIPAGALASPWGINNANEIVGTYQVLDGTIHGFFRDPDGVLTFPIDLPGAVSTYLRGINDRHVIAGAWVDGSGVTQAFTLELPNRFTTFAYTGGTATGFQAINDKGLITGWYYDSARTFHGLVARITHSGGEK
jgi:hypothetical protein